MTVDYYPPTIYSFLVKLQEENKLGMKELKTMIIRKVLQDLGLDCDHSDIGYSPSKKPYCKRCWTRLNQTNQAIVMFLIVGILSFIMFINTPNDGIYANNWVIPLVVSGFLSLFFGLTAPIAWWIETH